MPVPDADADDQPDEVLVARFAAGDAPAFDALYRRHEMRVWRFVRRMVGSDALADDLMQDVWFAVARHLPRWRPEARFTTWLFTLARHRVIDQARASRPQVSIDADDDGPGGIEPLAADSGFGPQRQAQAREQGRALLAAIEALPSEQREAFLLQAEGDLSVQEIAEATGTSFETAKSRLRYAREKLRAQLREHA